MIYYDDKYESTLALPVFNCLTAQEQNNIINL